MAKKKRAKERWHVHLDGLDSATEPCTKGRLCRAHSGHVPTFEVARRAIVTHLMENADRHFKRLHDYLDGVRTWQKQSEKGWRE